jgi:hypothetical protein
MTPDGSGINRSMDAMISVSIMSIGMSIAVSVADGRRIAAISVCGIIVSIGIGWIAVAIPIRRIAIPIIWRG